MMKMTLGYVILFSLNVYIKKRVVLSQFKILYSVHNSNKLHTCKACHSGKRTDRNCSGNLRYAPLLKMAARMLTHHFNISILHLHLYQLLNDVSSMLPSYIRLL